MIINHLKHVMRQLKKFLKRFRTKFKKSYSQSGEDMVLNTIFAYIKDGFYIDVGANDPYFQSNTQFFYNKSWRGINLDANSKSISKLKRKRVRDINIEALISDKIEDLEYYYFEDSAYNGCVNKVQSELLYSKKVKSIPLTNLLQEKNIQAVDILSIDVEGFELKVIKSLDLANIRPKAIVVESFSKNVRDDLNSEISKYLENYNYIYFARTVTNTIYLSNEFHSVRF
jgi:FkbM family methyltransferase